MACCNGNALCVVPGNDTPGHPCRKATDTEFAAAVARERAGQKGVTSADLRIAAEWAVEERLAWDRYAASLAGCSGFKMTDAARFADDLLEERRKRFGDK